MIDFKNKSVIITGSARGIGKAIALKFGGLGANLVIVDMNEEATKATAEELKGFGAKSNRTNFISRSKGSKEKRENKRQMLISQLECCGVHGLSIRVFAKRLGCKNEPDRPS